MKSKLSFLVVVAVIVVCAVSGNAQYAWRKSICLEDSTTNITLSPSDSVYLEQYRPLTHPKRVDKAWLHTLGRNSYSYPNPDLVQPGAALLTPMGTYCHADTAGPNSMWYAAALFVTRIVDPYLAGTLPSGISKPDAVAVDTTIFVENADSFPKWVWLVLAAIVLAIILAIRYLNRDKQQMEEQREAHERQQERNRKFVPDPPNFQTAPDHAVRRQAQIAATRAYGPHVHIVGEVKRGHFTGTVEMVNADGSTTTEQFDHEPGYTARVRFLNGTEADIFCRWACFNPVYNVIGANCDGTFTPDGSEVSEKITPITSEQMDALKQSVKGERELAAAELPLAEISEQSEETTAAVDDGPAVVQTDEAAGQPSTHAADQLSVGTTPDPEHQIVKIGGCQVSKSRLTLDTFEGTPAQLDKVLDTLTRHSKAIGGDENPSK